MPRTTAPSTNPRILAGYAPYGKARPKDSDSFPRPGPAASTSEERRQLLLNDPFTRDVQPEQVTCARCSKTVRLQKGKMYHLAHWLDHRWRCDKTDPNQQPRPRCRTLLERKAYLEADPDALIVKPDHVVCGRCDKEVKLRKNRPYGLSCWTAHKQSYHNDNRLSPASPISTSFSSLSIDAYDALKADSLVLRIDGDSIKCASCLKWIDIGYHNDYDVNVWRRHRHACLSAAVAEHSEPHSEPPPLPPMRLQQPESGPPQIIRADQHSLSKPSIVPPLSSFETSGDSSDTEEVPKTIPRIHDWVPDFRRRQSSGGGNNSAEGPIILPPPPSLLLSSSSSRRSASVSPPPQLSFSTVTSASTSVASTPMTSPQFHRKTTLFPNSRHLPPPENCFSRFPPGGKLDHHHHHHHRSRPPPPHHASALGLLLPPLPPPPPPPPRSPLLPHCSSSPKAKTITADKTNDKADAGTAPPPFLECTPISLPIPDRYWRFESTD